MGKEQELLDAARTGNILVVEKILSNRAKKAGPLAPLARWVTTIHQNIVFWWKCVCSGWNEACVCQIHLQPLYAIHCPRRSVKNCPYFPPQYSIISELQLSRLIQTHTSSDNKTLMLLMARTEKHQLGFNICQGTGGTDIYIIAICLYVFILPCCSEVV